MDSQETCTTWVGNICKKVGTLYSGIDNIISQAMESSRSCQSCGKKNLVPDHQTGNLVCCSCDVVQDFDNFQAQIGGITGPAGTYVRVGSAGTGSVYSYKETKVYEARKLIEDLMFKLGLSDMRSIEVKAMVERVTEGEYGQGRWFTVFVGACAYVVMRRDNKMLPIVEVANLVGCDSCELGRMVNHVINFLDLKLPEVDIVNLFKRSIKSCPSFGGISEDVIERMLKQGVFLVQCSMKWFLTTGRRPVPIVVAILVFVAELNQEEVKIENVAKELHAAVHTCKKRYKELLERLVKVAQALPWGKDVTVKNILKNAPFVIQYMELKSMSKCSDKGRLKPVGIAVEDIIGDYLSKDIRYAFDTNDTENDLQYFKVEPSRIPEGPNSLQISHECLAMMYSKFLDEVPLDNSAAETGELNKRIRTRGYDLHACREWWTGKSGLSKELLLKQILEEDVGLNANPPSFDRAQLAYERRRKRIRAAKMRIQRIMHPSESVSGYSDGFCLSKCVNAGKRRREMQVEIDWEDFIIETLLLHQAAAMEAPGLEAPDNSDPGSDVKPQVIYRCKKCRRIVASQDLVVPHEPGGGQKCFKWKRRSKDPGDQELPECSSIFVEPMRWMETVQDGCVGDKIQCMGCKTRLGSFNWAGMQCNCGKWINPAFQLHKSRIDECHV